MKGGMLFGALVIGAVVYWVFATESGFTDADIVAVKNSIKEEFQKRDGTTVSDVQMMRENSKKLIGFAKLKLTNVNFEITKSCSATYGDRQYI